MKSAIHRWFGASALELAIEEVVGDDRPQTIVLRQPSTSGSSLQAVNTHQPLDAMQATDKAFGQKVVPDAAHRTFL